MTKFATKTAVSLAKYWLLEIFAVLALSLLMPVEAEAKFSEKNCSYTDFDHLAALYYRQSKVKESKSALNQPVRPRVELNATVYGANKLADEAAKNPLIDQIQAKTLGAPNAEHVKIAARYPEGAGPDKVVKAVITAYTSTPDQTDSTPDIAASGKKVYDGMIAANWLPFGTKIKIPALYGDKIFTVDDRMNSRYGYGRMDVWLDTSKAEAKKFGVKRVEVHVFMEKRAPTKLTLAK